MWYNDGTLIFAMHKNKQFIVTLFLLVFSVGTFFFVTETNAATGLQYTLLEKIPGAPAVTSDLPGYIEALYRVALIAVVLSAVVMLSIGGFMYLTSAGNTSALGTAKDVIFDAIVGLVIALVAYLILNVINPDLVNVSINGLSAISAGAPITPGAPQGPSGVYGGTTVGGCTGCIPVSGVDIKPVGQGCASPGPCQLNEQFLTKLQGVSATSPSWWVTEAWPPTVVHKSACHANGTCADINFTDKADDVASVKTLYTAIKKAGLNTVYETFSPCDPYTGAGIFCKRFDSTTGSHFHVY